MQDVSVPAEPNTYALATGADADYRLGILHDVYGPGTRQVLLASGLKPGIRAADIGCGVGRVTALLSELVGPEGHVFGVDFSDEQIAQARKRLNTSAKN